MTPKTPEERKAIAQKAQATRRANKERREREEREAQLYPAHLRVQIFALETRLAELKIYEKMNIASAALTNKSLLSFEDIVKDALPWGRACGVYFLVQGTEVVYVGQSVNIYSRISQHTDKRFDKYAFVPCEAALLDKLESLYIHTLRPKLNGNYSAKEKAAPIMLNKLLSMV